MRRYVEICVQSQRANGSVIVIIPMMDTTTCEAECLFSYFSFVLVLVFNNLSCFSLCISVSRTAKKPINSKKSRVEKEKSI